MSTNFADQSEMAIVLGCVRLRFRPVEDRWTHCVDSLRDGAWGLFAEPLQTEPERDDSRRVLNPTYQEVHLQRTKQGDQLLAIGRWGKHHYSAVFSLRETENETILAVDVADRCRVPFDSLACTYRVSLVPGQLIDASPKGATWEEAGYRRRIEIDAPERLAVAELGRTGMSVQIQAAMIAGAFTQRCRYRWVLQRHEQGKP